MSSKYVGVGEEKARGHQPARRAAAPVRLEFVVRPPLGAGPRPGSGRPNGHCSARHGPPMWPPAKVNSVWSFNDAWLRTSWSEARRQAPRNGASSLDAARVLGIRDAHLNFFQPICVYRHVIPEHITGWCMSDGVPDAHATQRAGAEPTTPVLAMERPPAGRRPTYSFPRAPESLKSCINACDVDTLAIVDNLNSVDATQSTLA